MAHAANPNWGKGKDTPLESTTCAFEVKANELGLASDQYLRSEELRAWAAANKNTRYVPETLLKAWHLTPDSSV
jgi:hypothetical protein